MSSDITNTNTIPFYVIWQFMNLFEAHAFIPRCSVCTGSLKGASLFLLDKEGKHDMCHLNLHCMRKKYRGDGSQVSGMVYWRGLGIDKVVGFIILDKKKISTSSVWEFIRNRNGTFKAINDHEGNIGDPDFDFSFYSNLGNTRPEIPYHISRIFMAYMTETADHICSICLNKINDAMLFYFGKEISGICHYSAECTRDYFIETDPRWQEPLLCVSYRIKPPNSEFAFDGFLRVHPGEKKILRISSIPNDVLGKLGSKLQFGGERERE